MERSSHSGVFTTPHGFGLGSARLAGALLLAALTGLAGTLISPAPPPRPIGVEGIVLTDEGVPLAGAVVRVQATPVTAVTDAAGRFRLEATNGRVTASKQGYFIGGAVVQPRLTLRLRRLPTDDHPDYAWIDPTPGKPHNCGTCHEAIYREWAGSAHARSVTGRHFRDLYEGTDALGRPGVSWGLKTDFPDGAGVCSSCHAPALADGDAARFDLGRTSGVAALGVHCDYCHKVVGTGPNAPALTHGSFDLRLLRPTEGQLFLGPLDDVDRGEDAYAALYRDSRYCASCHEGVVFGVHAYSTYSEWLASPARHAGKQCQDCHMAATGTLGNIAPGHGGLRRDPGTLASHGLFAGSRESMLRQAIDVAASLQPEGKTTRVEVRVRAHGAGHRVPTGFLDRHLLLVVEASDEDGHRLPLTAGPTLPAAAGTSLAGQAGRIFGRVKADFDGHAPVPFWRGGPDPVDTRLRPDEADVSTYAFPSGCQRVRIRLLYRLFWQEVVAAKGWPDDTICVRKVEVRAPKRTPDG